MVKYVTGRDAVLAAEPNSGVYGNAQSVERMLGDIYQLAMRIANGVSPQSAGEGKAEPGVDGIDAILCRSLAGAHQVMGVLCNIEQMLFGEMFQPPGCDGGVPTSSNVPVRR